MAGLYKVAIVRFQEDRQVYLTNVLNIKDFKPNHARDFNPNEVYDVKWEKSSLGVESHSGRYPAEILLLGVSENEIKLKFKANFPKLRLLGALPYIAPSTQPSKGTSGGGTGDGRPKSRRNANAAPRTNDKSGDEHHRAPCLTSNSQRGGSQKSKPSSTAVQSQTGDGTRKDRHDRRFAASSHRHSSSVATVPPVSKHFTQTSSKEQGVSDENGGEDNSALRRKNALLELKLARLSKGPKQNQVESHHNLFDCDGDDDLTQHDSSPTGNVGADVDYYEDDDNGPLLRGNENPNPGHQDMPDEQVDKQDNAIQSDGEVSSDEVVAQRVFRDLKGEELLKEDNGKVYIGKGYSIKSKMWKLKVRTAKSDSAFVKNLGHGLWGKKKLARRSLTGKFRSQGKRQATPLKVDCTLAALKGYIRTKNVHEATEPFLVEKARKNLAQKMSDCGRDNDPNYRKRVQGWNAKRKQRRAEARLQAGAADGNTSSSADDSSAD